MKTRNHQTRRTFVALTVGTLLLLSGLGVALAQNIAATPTYGTVNLRAGFMPDPHRVNVRAGGPNQTTISGCAGYINNAAPDVDLNYTAGGMPLNIYVTSAADTTLVVNLPDGRWICNDDAHGTNPLINLPNPQSGNYNIWVGNFGNSSTPPAVLHISELAPQW